MTLPAGASPHRATFRCAFLIWSGRPALITATWTMARRRRTLIGSRLVEVVMQLILPAGPPCRPAVLSEDGACVGGGSLTGHGSESDDRSILVVAVTRAATVTATTFGYRHIDIGVILTACSGSRMRDDREGSRSSR